MKYNADDRFEVTEEMLIPINPFNNFRINFGTKGTVCDHKNIGVYMVKLDNNGANVVYIDKDKLDASSKLIDHGYFSEFEEVTVSRTDVQTEDRIIKMTADIWSEFKTIKQTHPSDMEDLADAIHDIQKIIAVRIARRIKPEQFVAYKK